MPYIGSKREQELIADPSVANTPGDYNALYTMAYLKEFLKEPRYHTIHAIKKESISPTPVTLDLITDVDHLLFNKGVGDLDRITARELAFLEFYERVGKPYENLARQKNGDLQLYKEAQKVLHEMAKEIAAKLLTGDKK